jgi:hypothetical protein
VRRRVKIDGREYIVSLLPGNMIEFRQFRKHDRYRFSLAAVLVAAAREFAESKGDDK